MTPDEERRAPASMGQRLMWLLERRGAGNGGLNVFYALRLRGPLREEALLGALRELPARHEGLRTTFRGRGPGLVQVVHRPYPVTDRVVGSRDVPESDLRDAVRAEIHHQFDLNAEWPCRMRLFRVGRADHVLTIVVHHIVTDGWSMGVLMDDLRMLYADNLGCQAKIQEPSEWHQADFALWQQQCVADGSFAKKAEYWRDLLGAGQPIRLPTILRLPSPDRENDAGIMQYNVPVEIETQFREAAKGRRSSFFSALLAAFSGYLAACTGQEEIVVPVFFANRTRLQMRRTFGYITNLLLLPIDLTGQPAFPELVSQVAQVILKASANQDVPYHVVPPLSEEAPRRRHPELVVDYFKIDGSNAIELTQLEVSSYELGSATGARFALELHFIERSDGLKVACVYSADRTCADAITRFLDGFIDFASLLPGGDIGDAGRRSRT